MTSVLAASPGRAVDFSFANTNLLLINDSQSPPTLATPYPSTNLVTGLTGMVVLKATVTLSGLSHGFPSDIIMELVGPTGRQCLLMAQAGGQSKFSVTNLTITLDDNAPNSLPVFTSLVSGAFKPVNGYFAIDGTTTNLLYDLPAPAPPGNSNAPPALSVFKGTDPTGPWRLFVVDDSAPNSGALSNGWTLSLSVGVPLSLSRAQTNVVLSWTNAVQGCTAQWNTNPGAPWVNLTSAPASSGGHYWLTNRITGRTAFYRLVK